ncbi:MAG: hypothetical protein WCA12_07255, partial [Burkholderiales bacterium]
MKFEHVNHADTHTPNTEFPAAPAGLGRDASEEVAFRLRHSLSPFEILIILRPAALPYGTVPRGIAPSAVSVDSTAAASVDSAAGSAVSAASWSRVEASTMSTYDYK